MLWDTEIKMCLYRVSTFFKVYIYRSQQRWERNNWNLPQLFLMYVIVLRIFLYLRSSECLKEKTSTYYREETHCFQNKLAFLIFADCCPSSDLGRMFGEQLMHFHASGKLFSVLLFFLVFVIWIGKSISFASQVLLHVWACGETSRSNKGRSVICWRSWS